MLVHVSPTRVKLRLFQLALKFARLLHFTLLLKLLMLMHNMLFRLHLNRLLGLLLLDFSKIRNHRHCLCNFRLCFWLFSLCTMDNHLDILKAFFFNFLQVLFCSLSQKPHVKLLLLLLFLAKDVLFLIDFPQSLLCQATFFFSI